MEHAAAFSITFEEASEQKNETLEVSFLSKNLIHRLLLGLKNKIS